MELSDNDESKLDELDELSISRVAEFERKKFDFSRFAQRARSMNEKKFEETKNYHRLMQLVEREETEAVSSKKHVLKTLHSVPWPSETSHANSFPVKKFSKYEIPDFDDPSYEEALEIMYPSALSPSMNMLLIPRNFQPNIPSQSFANKNSLDEDLSAHIFSFVDKLETENARTQGDEAEEEEDVTLDDWMDGTHKHYIGMWTEDNLRTVLDTIYFLFTKSSKRVPIAWDTVVDASQMANLPIYVVTVLHNRLSEFYGRQDRFVAPLIEKHHRGVNKLGYLEPYESEYEDTDMENDSDGQVDDSDGQIDDSDGQADDSDDQVDDDSDGEYVPLADSKGTTI